MPFIGSDPGITLQVVSLLFEPATTPLIKPHAPILLSSMINQISLEIMSQIQTLFNTLIVLAGLCFDIFGMMQSQ